MNFIDKLNIKTKKLEQNNFLTRIELNDFHAQPQGFLNGGITLAFAEISAGIASNNILDKNFFAVGQSISANHLKPKKSSGLLFAKGSLLHYGKKSHVWSVAIIDENNNLISNVTIQNSIVKIKE